MTRADLLVALADIERQLDACGTLTRILVGEDGREVWRRVTRTPGRESIIITRRIVSPRNDEQGEKP